jgi:hypothetical protein
VAFEILPGAIRRRKRSRWPPPAAPGPKTPRGSPISPLFGVPVVDLDEYRGGKLPAEIALALKATYRARGQSQFASEIGLSQPQLCNALCGRFGLFSAIRSAASEIVSRFAISRSCHAPTRIALTKPSHSSR